jgi:hypothetical protein
MSISRIVYWDEQSSRCNLWLSHLEVCALLLDSQRIHGSSVESEWAHADGGLGRSLIAEEVCLESCSCLRLEVGVVVGCASMVYLYYR